MGCVAFWVVLLGLALSGTLMAADPASPLDHIRPEHPRILATEADFARAKAFIKDDATAGRWYAWIEGVAAKALDDKPVQFRAGSLLEQSRTALRRIILFAGMYRLSGEKRYRDRALLEMESLCAFESWNPPGFLDTAEALTAVSIGYDWLHETLSEEDRKRIVDAMVRLGLEPGLRAYEGDAQGRGKAWWAKNRNNWNQVCNGGLLMGALAIAEEQPDLARRIAAHAIENLPIALASYGPDGGWAEGPMYWGYATKYSVFALAAMKTALGTDFGMSQTPGFSQCGWFRIHSFGSSGRMFNYADSVDYFEEASHMMWLAREFGRPEWAGHEKSRMRYPDILHLLWYVPGGHWPVESVEKCVTYRGIEVAYLRSSWDDAQSLWIGIKGGDNRAPHGHVDLGSFCVDWAGERFVSELGADDYGLPNYWNDKRYNYYRLSAAGHNTLTVNGENQKLDAKAAIAAFEQTGDGGRVRIDLSAAYPGLLSRWERTAELNAAAVTLSDAVNGDGKAQVTWGIHTEAKVELSADGRSATLVRNGKSMRAELLSPEDAKFAATPVKLDQPQRPANGITKLTVDLHNVADATITVAFRPVP